MSDPNDSTSTDDGASLSSTFLEFCDKVRKDDPSILPAPGQSLRINQLCEKESMELADALLENTSVTYLTLKTEHYTKSSAEAMAKYLRTSKRLQSIRLYTKGMMKDGRLLQQRDEIKCSLLMPAVQESTSLQKLNIDFPLIGGPSNLAFENMLTHTQSLRFLTLICHSIGSLEDKAVSAVSSGLKNNTTLRELKLEFWCGGMTASPILTSLLDHPLLRRLCLHGHVGNLTGLETVLLSDNSKITELVILNSLDGPAIVGLTHVLQALARHTTLTKLKLHNVVLRSDKMRQLGMILCNTQSLQTVVLINITLGSAELAELAPALYRNTSIKELDISRNNLNDMESAELLRSILWRNKTMTALDISFNRFGQTTGAFECIADGLGSNLSLQKINLSFCRLRDDGVSILAQTLGSRNTTLQKLALEYNSITSTGVGALLEMMEQNSHHITDLELDDNLIGNEGTSLLAGSLGNNALPNLTRLSLARCGIGDDGFIALVSALEQNTSLRHLNLRLYKDVSEQVFLALAESLPDIKVLQQVDLSWCTGLASAMPLLLAGLRKNKSLFRFNVTECAPSSVPPTAAETARCAGGWMREMEWLGYRNRFLPMIGAPKERLPPRGVWPHALARVATLPGVMFQVLRSKPSLVPSEDTDGKEAAKDTGAL
jgi:Ran GTPase-activating protein (RanGAP) involved in mRNA processing and transport